MRISVVIPALDAASYLPGLLDSLERQILPPDEIVIIDSSRDRGTELALCERQGTIPLIYRRVDFAYPGHARNLGVAAASYEWIAFLDCRTVPYDHWLQEASSLALSERADFVGGLLICRADSFFKKALQAATYGNKEMRTLPGSLVRRRVFQYAGGFVATARAGEDIEWMGRVAAVGTRMSVMETAIAHYEGFPESLWEAIRKWHIYTLANARIDVRNTQKMLYVTLFVSASVLFAYKWNALFARWRVHSILYIPNVTKIFVATLIGGYFLYRGLIRPLRKEVSPWYLLPWRWLVVLFIALTLDLAKAPGMLMGALILLFNRTRWAAKAVSPKTP